jgi:hypothetical protein
VPARSRGPRPGRCESGPALIMCRCRRSARHRRRLSNLSVCVCAKEERAPPLPRTIIVCLCVRMLFACSQNKCMFINIPSWLHLLNLPQERICNFSSASPLSQLITSGQGNTENKAEAGCWQWQRAALERVQARRETGQIRASPARQRSSREQKGASYPLAPALNEPAVRLTSHRALARRPSCKDRVNALLVGQEPVNSSDVHAFQRNAFFPLDFTIPLVCLGHLRSEHNSANAFSRLKLRSPHSAITATSSCLGAHRVGAAACGSNPQASAVPFVEAAATVHRQNDLQEGAHVIVLPSGHGHSHAHAGAE